MCYNASMRAIWAFLRRFWLPITIGAVIILGFAIWVQFFKETNCFAKWVFVFLSQWATVLSATVTLLLAFAAFWVISETRHFRYLDEETNTIADLNKWATDTFKHLAMLSRFAANTTELKMNFAGCRAELMTKVADSISVFAQARKLLTSVRTRQVGQELNSQIDTVDAALRGYIDTLFEVEIDKVTQAQSNEVVDQAATLTEQLRKLMEMASKL